MIDYCLLKSFSDEFAGLFSAIFIAFTGNWLVIRQKTVLGLPVLSLLLIILLMIIWSFFILLVISLFSIGLEVFHLSYLF